MAEKENAQDEIQKIMSEIEDLRREMEEDSEPEVTGLDPRELAAETLAEAEEDSTLERLAAGTDDEGGVDELDSFRSSASDDAGLEDTLMGLEEEAAPDHSLLSESGMPDPNESLAEAMDAMEASVASVPGEENEDEIAEADFEQKFEELTAAAAPAAAESRPAPTPPPAPNVVPISSARKEISVSGGSAAVTLEVEGNVDIRLRYKGTGQEIHVVAENDAFVIRLADGSEFRTPLQKGRLRASS